jgi:hypothetical protein
VNASVAGGVELLGGADIRELAAKLGVVPTKKLGQNFVTDPNTIRRIVAAAKLSGTETVVEIGPGLGSLTLGLLEVAKKVVAVEIDPKLASELEATVAKRMKYPIRTGILRSNAFGHRDFITSPPPRDSDTTRRRRATELSGRACSSCGVNVAHAQMKEQAAILLIWHSPSAHPLHRP